MVDETRRATVMNVPTTQSKRAHPTRIHLSSKTVRVKVKWASEERRMLAPSPHHPLTFQTQTKALAQTNNSLHTASSGVVSSAQTTKLLTCAWQWNCHGTTETLCHANNLNMILLKHHRRSIFVSQTHSDYYLMISGSSKNRQWSWL